MKQNYDFFLKYISLVTISADVYPGKEYKSIMPRNNISKLELEFNSSEI